MKREDKELLAKMYCVGTITMDQLAESIERQYNKQFDVKCNAMIEVLEYAKEYRQALDEAAISEL
jgi:hypothetical protein